MVNMDGSTFESRSGKGGVFIWLDYCMHCDRSNRALAV